MAATVADVRSLPPGYRFKPEEKELVEFYLLPRACGLPDPFPGVDITEDDAAASTQPWKLFERHNLDEKDEPYFWVRGNDAKPGARQDRLVDGGYKWKSQRRVPRVLDVGGVKINWTKHILSLKHGDGGGSLGWVMHEYTIADPNCGHIKICHIAFTGHGQKRKRVPEESDACESEPKSQRACAAAAVSPPMDSGTRKTSFNQETGQILGTAAAAPPLDSGMRKAFDQETEQILGTAPPLDSGMTKAFNQETEQVFGAMEQEHLQGQSYLSESTPQRLNVATAPPASSSAMASQFNQETEQVPAGTMEHMGDEHCQDGSAHQSSSGGSQTMAIMLDQDSGASAQAHQDLSDDLISQMVDEMTVSLECNWNDHMSTSEQQVMKVAMLPSIVQESGTTNHGYGSPRFCGMLDTAASGALNGGLWGGNCFC